MIRFPLACWTIHGGSIPPLMVSIGGARIVPFIMLSGQASAAQMTPKPSCPGANTRRRPGGVASGGRFDGGAQRGGSIVKIRPRPQLRVVEVVDLRSADVRVGAASVRQLHGCS